MVNRNGISRVCGNLLCSTALWIVSAILLINSLNSSSALAADITATTITVYWTAPGDDGMSGTSNLYEIRVSTDSITEANWNSAAVSLNPPIPSAAGSAEQHTVSGLSPGVTYFVAVKARDESGNWSELSNIVSATTHIVLDVDDYVDAVIPRDYSLMQNFPNPFNPTTRIEFDLPRSEFVDFTIYNSIGQKIKSLDLGNMGAGRHMVEWNGTDDYGQAMASGVYFYSLSTENFVQTRKMVLLK